MLTRRAILMTPLAALAVRPVLEAAGTMTLAIHQQTSTPAGYKRSLEGWAKAGIRHVELTANLLDDFLKTDSLPAASRVLSDNGLTPVSAACGIFALWDPGTNQATVLDSFRKRCEQFASLGLKRIYAPSVVNRKVTEDDYKAAAENMRAVGDVAKQFGLTAMIEFTRTSTMIATLPTSLNVTRAAAHPNVAPMIDCYHFWSGNNKLEDLDLIKPGEIGHMHFQDVPSMPRELLDNTTRAIPGDGISPLTAILGKLAAKGYAGSLSVELFLPKFTQADPFELAAEIKRKGEAVMRQARVL